MEGPSFQSGGKRWERTGIHLLGTTPGHSLLETTDRRKTLKFAARSEIVNNKIRGFSQILLSTLTSAEMMGNIHCH